MSGSRLVITDKAGNPLTGEVEGLSEDGGRRVAPYKNGLREGMAVTAVIKASDVMLAVA